MKDYIDLDSQPNKPFEEGKVREIACNFSSTVSVFNNKWHSWRRKQKMKKPSNGEFMAILPVMKPITRQHRET